MRAPADTARTAFVGHAGERHPESRLGVVLATFERTGVGVDVRDAGRTAITSSSFELFRALGL